MYVGYVLDKDSPVYPGPARPASLSLGPQAYGPEFKKKKKKELAFQCR